MTTIPLHPATRQPVDPVPDMHSYPVGASHTMPSHAHDEARTVSRALLRTVLPAQGLVVGELAVLGDEHNWRDHLVPDLMVALGAGELDPVYGVKRLQYRIWHELGPPDLVVEFASRSTVGRDNLGRRVAAAVDRPGPVAAARPLGGPRGEDYAALGVREYVQFDPLGELLDPRLQVHRLAGDRYERVAAEPDGAVPSDVVVGYAWVAAGDVLRLRERSTGHLVPTPEEARTTAEARARREQARADAAEDELAHLRAELARLRGAQPPATPPDSES